jgi:L-lactate dehydrogenase complex protein LldF
MSNKPFDFKKNVTKALGDEQLRRNLKFAMDTMIQKRRAVFNDQERLETLREQASAIRQHSLENLPELLQKLEQKCTNNGIRVHWAESVTAANQIVLEIIRRHKASRVVKGKSMVSEEMHLNRFLQQNGIEPLETDLGEFIIQLAGETPSHIIVPAIHKNRAEIAELFHDHIPDTPYTEVVEELNAIARQTLRHKFFEAEVGISGVNLAVAETGTLCLIENEGNGRMCTTLPPVHIALMGLEKVVEKLADIPPILELLTGSATGQRMTTYFNLITSPRKPGEKDGPREVHLILLDNGRTRILADPELRQTLKCIRCGTCLNHCPVYTRIGGHAFGYVYPGPIGTILTPQMAGLEKTEGIPDASSLCNACEEVCPVKIPIPALIRRIRNESRDDQGVVKGHGSQRSWLETAAWKGWALVNTHPTVNRLSQKAIKMLGPGLPNAGPIKKWSRIRTTPRLSKLTLQELAQQEGVENE